MNLRSLARRQPLCVGVLSVVMVLTEGRSAALEGQTPLWRVSATPTVSVSGAPGRGGEFENVSDVLRLPNGNIVAADRAHRLMLFSNEGGFLRSIGRQGSGPGEFARSPLWLQLIRGDTILTFEFGNGYRLTYFTGEGAYARSVSVSSSSGRPAPRSSKPPIWYRGALSDGSLVGTIMDPISAPRPAALPARRPGEMWVYRGWVEIMRTDSRGDLIGSLGVFPGSDEIGGGRVAVMANVPPEPVLRDTHVATGPDRVYVATGERFRVLVLSAEGDTIGIIQRGQDLRQVTKEDLIARYLVMFPQAEERLRAARWYISDNQTAPALLDLVVAESGELWIEEGREDVQGPGTWHVYDGLRHVATVEMPPRFRPRHISEQSILGIWSDQFDVDWVQERAIEGPG